MTYGLIGKKLVHSFSKDIHEKIGRYRYEHVELDEGDVAAFLEKREFDGINVTMPYKQTVIPYLDEISELAESVGAVNTIVNSGGRLKGYNTDCGGIKMLIEMMGLDLTGRKVLILGAGGTSLTARRVARDLGAGSILRLSRNESEEDDVISYADAYENHSGAHIVINTTPVGMYPDVDGIPLDVDRFGSLEGVIDVTYNPLNTNMILQARERGIPAENGLYMLVCQAMLAAELFTGEPVPRSEAERIYGELSAEKRNIVLTGMPGSGKTTIGGLLAEKLGRELVSTDDMVIEKENMPITEIFRLYGEKYFRDDETEMIKKSSLTGGKIIATGGGAILRDENIRSLKMNGTIVFLDRSPEELIPSDDRPLADRKEKIFALYDQRYDIYTGTADLIVDVSGTEEQTAERVWGLLR